MDCGKNLKKYRQMKGWSQKELAEKSGVSERTIGYIENGIVSPTLKTLQALANGLDVSPMILIERAA